MGRVDGKVAFVTGAARGQGRSHAVRLAEEGADIIAVDICHDLESLKYSLASPEDLKETVRLVEATGSRIIAEQADVREPAQLKSALERGISELGKLDIVVAQAGIIGQKAEPEQQVQAWTDVMGTNFVGVLNAVHTALPHLGEDASIVVTGSTAAMMITRPMQQTGTDLGGVAYMVAKQLLSQFIHELATHLAPRRIRANVVHPTNVNTPMLHADPMIRSFRPDLAEPKWEDAVQAFPVQQAMPVPYVEPVDISNAVLFLASDEARYVTGVQLRVDAGGYLKWYDYHA
ncbi:mycofactocin-coupled SDR family oxidoreductase [Amycolatopsis acidicola]|uniref:Mycofactocin-coupled SDR family oxidoreductase n=1 Tax=Amycolatopsis acidicola TaxID=2596893 RepID=A0A5N0UUS5_9PSEU|nr:mycofactocin-coupled SDR family oxidoreductase [Amycolatopsis acidicola]KAA9155377.1 mycofactocin-coupled SDR family oxidoreductase [Amycolatopsis acidicola]